MSKAADNAKVESQLAYARRSGEDLRMPCPFCAEQGHQDKKTSLILYASGNWRCFRCETKGWIKGYASADHRERARVAEPLKVQVFEPLEDFLELAREPARSAESYEQARAYLEERGVKPSTIRRARVGVCDWGRWAGRVIVPILAPDEATWLGWVGRIWSKKVRKDAQGTSGMKYLYPPGMSRGQILYNQRALDLDTDRPVLVVEGVWDVLPYLDDAVAALGKLSEDQIALLMASKRPICLVPDGDEWQSAWAMSLRMRFDGHRAGFIRLPPRVDPDEVDPQWLLEEAQRSLDREA